MIDFSKIKLKGGWAMDRERFSDHAREVFEFAVSYRRKELKPSPDMFQGVRFNDNAAVLARLESMFTEVEFIACPGLTIDRALADAAQSDWWYQFEKQYDDEYHEECEIEEETE